MLRSISVAAVVVLACLHAHGEDRALLLSKSVGYQHAVIALDENNTSLVESVLRSLLDDRGIALDATKDASIVSEEGLAPYKLVIFYTQGDLTQEGLDHAPLMSADGVEALRNWIENGGGFMAFHSGADTLRPRLTKDPATPYTSIVGGAFFTHGRQFRGNVVLTDPGHPALKGIHGDFTMLDEWYVFTHLDTEHMHVLAMLDPGAERAKQHKYDLPTYPVVWCKKLGQGRVYYNAMGHRPDVWTNETFRQMVLSAVPWVVGKKPLHADPNYADVVPGK